MAKKSLAFKVVIFVTVITMVIAFIAPMLAMMAMS